MKCWCRPSKASDVCLAAQNSKGEGERTLLLEASRGQLGGMDTCMHHMGITLIC